MHFFCEFKNIIFDISKYNKYTNSGAKHMRDFSKQISKKKLEVQLQNYAIKAMIW